MAGGLGMNLTNGLEEHPTAFYITSGATLVMMTGLFGLLMRRFRSLDVEGTSRAKMSQYHALKNFQTVMDNVEASLASVECPTMTKAAFEDLVHSIVPGAQPDEIDLIFKSMDLDKSGAVDNTDLLVAKRQKWRRRVMKPFLHPTASS